MRFKLAPNLRLTLAAIQDDEVLEQPRLVIVERLHLDGATSASARREEAMAVGVRAGADVLDQWTLRHLGPADDEGDDAPAVQKDQPPDRSREDEVALPVLEVRVPSHLLGKCQVTKQPAHDVGKDVDSSLAALARSEEHTSELQSLRHLVCRLLLE